MISEFRASIVISESFYLLFRHFVTIFSIAFICCLPMTLAFLADWDRRAEPAELGDLTEIVQAREDRETRKTIAGLSFYIAFPLATGAIALAVYRSLRGERVSLLESLGAALRRIFTLLGVFVCSVVAVCVAFLPALLFASAFRGMLPLWITLVVTLVLLVIGFNLMMMVSVAAPVAVVERKGVFASLQRSQELTAGHRWRMFLALFGVALAGFLLIFVVGRGVVAVALSMSDFLQGSPWIAQFMGVFSLTFLMAWTATATALGYYQLRSVKELVDVVDVAAVFD
jgi:hypothetical protein